MINLNLLTNTATRGLLLSLKPFSLITFQFNPQLKHDMKPNWSMINAVHSDLPLGVFTSMGSHSISFELWFDAATMAYLRGDVVTRGTRKKLNQLGGLLDVMARLQALVEPVPVGPAGLWGQNVSSIEVPLQAPEVYFVYGLRTPMKVRTDSIDWTELEHDTLLRPIRVKASIKLSIIPDSVLYRFNKGAMRYMRMAGAADDVTQLAISQFTLKGGH